MFKHAAIFVTALVVAAIGCVAQPDTLVIKATGPIQSLEGQLPTAFGAPASVSAEPYANGKISPDKAQALLTALNSGADNPRIDLKKTTIINILRWKDAAHTAVMFQKWYLYDPMPSKTSLYLMSKQDVFEQTAIPGRTDFQFVYIHLNSDLLGGGKDEWATSPTAADGPGFVPKLKHPIAYTITVTKQQTQFIQDLTTLLQILGYGTKAAAAIPNIGYFSVTSFQSPWTTSSITIAASLDSSNKNPGSTDASVSNPKSTTSSTQLTSATYHNEKPSWIGLSAGVPLNSYKDVAYQSSSGTLVPSSITQQNVYVFLDFYVPPVLPTLASFRYLPHPFWGLPLKGEVFRHQMVGLGIGFHWLEPFGGVIFDTQNNKVTGPVNTHTTLTIKTVFGLKVSMSALATALKKK